MAKLESMIGDFVDGLLIAIGDASIDELRELFGQRPQGSGGALEQAAARVRATAKASASQPAPSKGGRGRRFGNRRFPDPSLASTPPGVAEITDPESLLSFDGIDANILREVRPTPVRTAPVALPAILAPSAASERRDRHAVDNHDTEGESPASGVRAVGGGAPVRLSDNETLARVSNSGVVIRRKKRA
jgi:hypothetical protein